MMRTRHQWMSVVKRQQQQQPQQAGVHNPHPSHQCWYDCCRWCWRVGALSTDVITQPAGGRALDVT